MTKISSQCKLYAMPIEIPDNQQIPTPSDVLQINSSQNAKWLKGSLDIERLCIEELKRPRQPTDSLLWKVALPAGEYSKESIAIAAEALRKRGWKVTLLVSGNRFSQIDPLKVTVQMEMPIISDKKDFAPFPTPKVTTPEK